MTQAHVPHTILDAYLIKVVFKLALEVAIDAWSASVGQILPRVAVNTHSSN